MPDAVLSIPDTLPSEEYFSTTSALKLLARDVIELWTLEPEHDLYNNAIADVYKLIDNRIREFNNA